MMNIFSSTVKIICQWWTKFKEGYFFPQKGDDTLSNRKITFSSSNDKIRTFFLEQNVNLPVAVYNELLGFLSKACTYEEEERRIRPSLIIGNNLTDKHVAKITQATVIPFVRENVDKAHLMKRLKAMLPFCNNGWRVFLSLENEELTYGIMRNFNGPSGLSLDDILANISVDDKESLGLNFVLVDIASNFEIILKGSVDSCTVDFRLIDDQAATGVRDNFCNDMLSAYDGDISKIATAYRKTISLFPQKLHGSICVIIKHEQLRVDEVADILDGTAEVCNFVTMQAIVHYLYKIKLFPEKINLDIKDLVTVQKTWQELLDKHKFYTLSRKEKLLSQTHSKNQAKSILNEFDLENQEAINLMLQFIKMASDMDVYTTNKSLKQFNRNMDWEADIVVTNLLLFIAGKFGL